MNIVRRLLPELTREGWVRAIGWTAVVTLGTCLLAIGGAAFSKSAVNGGAINTVDVITAIVLSFVLSVPVIGTLSIKIQELRLANEKIRRYATSDPMTGLLNRDTFTHLVETHLAPPPAERQGNGPGCLLAIDVDHFKLVNDAFGHYWGDEALKAISAAVSAELGSGDFCGRMGGEEFSAFLVGADRVEAHIVADRMRQSVSALGFEPEGFSCPLSISIGISEGVLGTSFTALYKEGDRLLYLAKHNGRNRVESAATKQTAEPVADDRPVTAHETADVPVVREKSAATG